MQQSLNFLRDHKEIALATCEGNLPKLRMFQIMKQEGFDLMEGTVGNGYVGERYSK